MKDSLNIKLFDRTGRIKTESQIDDSLEARTDFRKGLKTERIWQKKKQGLGETNDEIAVVERFLKAYNEVNNTDFENPQKEIEDKDVDVIACSRRTPKHILKMQIVKSDFEPWEYLHKKRFFNRTETGFSGVNSRIKKAVQHKEKHYPPAVKERIILLLEGWPAVRKEDIGFFLRTKQDFLRNTKFKEIWFIGITSEMIKKIK